MTGWTSLAEAEGLRRRTEALRIQWSRADEPARRELAAEMARLYLVWGLADRAADWLGVFQRLAGDPAARDRRAELLEAELLILRGEAAAALPLTSRVEAAPPVGAEVRLALASAQASLAAKPEDGFAVVERSLRVLRARKDPSAAVRLNLWKALWLRHAGREPEASAALRKALAAATETGDSRVVLEARLVGASAAGRSKALGLALEARELAAAEDRPAGVAEAEAVLSRWAGKPAEALERFRASVEAGRRGAERQASWDRECREADRPLLEELVSEARTWDARLLAGIAEALTRPTALAAALDSVYLPLRRLLPADIFGVALWLPDRRALDYALFIEDGVRTSVGMIPVDSPRSLGAWCFREGRPVRINDIEREYSQYLKELSRLTDHQPKSMLFLPLTAQGSCWGVATVQAFSRQAYGPEEQARFSVVAGLLALRIYGLDRSLAGAGSEPSRA